MYKFVAKQIMCYKLSEFNSPTLPVVGPFLPAEEEFTVEK